MIITSGELLDNAYIGTINASPRCPVKYLNTFEDAEKTI